MKNKRLRLDGIIDILQKKEKTTLEMLATRFEVSTATIRRDIALLENSGQVYQGKGGEVFYRKDYFGPTREFLLSKAINEKIRIAEYCTGLLREKETIIIAPGVITNLTGRILGGLDIELRVITNSLPLALELSDLDNINLFMLGGEVEKQHSVIHNLESDPMQGIQYADKLFMTADGIDLEYGMTYFEASGVPMVKGMMEVAKEIILIADSTKFGNVCFHYLEKFSRVTKIITDENIDPQIKKAFEQAGKELITV